MTQITHLRQIVQVRKKRACGYATVDLIQPDGSLRKREKPLVVHFPEHAQGAATAGSLWEVSGRERENAFTTANGLIISEYTIDATEIRFLKPSGKVLARWISSNIKGIGEVIAKRLVRLPKLAELIEKRERSSLLAVAGMSEARLDRLLEEWPDQSLYDTITWLEEQQLPLGLGEKLSALFGAEAIEKIKEHPFLLMAMGASFEKTMEIAKELGLTMADASVVAGVAQHVAVRHTHKTGSTVIDPQSLITGCAQVMQTPAPDNVGEIAVDHGLLVKVDSGYQVYGSALMEAVVALFLAKAHGRSAGTGSLVAGWEAGLTENSVIDALEAYEQTLPFQLTGDQRKAVVGSVLSPVCGISGGAGTGKTTILKAILGVYQALAGGMAFYQVALSGRAAQRMSESTGLPAQTIAKFIVDHIGEKKPRLPDHLLLVIDEASMVDLLSMYKLIGLLPEATRVIFVGDTAQLLPVGAGLVFHALQDTFIPFFHLTQVKRQGEESGIHRFATAIRNGEIEIPPQTEITLAKSADCSIEGVMTPERLEQLWKEAGGIGNSIVLCPVRKGEMGVDGINQHLQQSNGLERPSIYYQDDQRGWIPWVTSTGTELLLGDPILITANNYDEAADIRNGDLGVITVVYDSPENDSGAVAVAEINGTSIAITQDLLDKMQLGYAITIHKAQGSQWPTCFVVLPPEAGHMMDQTLLYTAATRPEERLVLMGSGQVIRKAVEKECLIEKRCVCLQERMQGRQRRENK
ncbi:ATP-dependent RecD-like DNA helicase [Endozoicomonas sp. ONNA2]|uniref:ATP-dependent RecD-like DNA helicase n=1 Tax=Endozoicomonas sp. ONNA2 TaxID=2828741 RepID=UPI00214945A8|nr:ATP-dependent RecD-like DNA helicase [Endozoicomonas sp. ONNA2]